MNTTVRPRLIAVGNADCRTDLTQDMKEMEALHGKLITPEGKFTIIPPNQEPI